MSDDDVAASRPLGAAALEAAAPSSVRRTMGMLPRWLHPIRRFWHRIVERFGRHAGRPDASTVPPRAPFGADGGLIEGRFGVAEPRRYLLYQPASPPPGPMPLLVLLHGCRQTADDFARSTGMNEAAEAAGVAVLYPEQSLNANLLRCWNWYALQDRSYAEGEATLLAALTRRIVRELGLDATRVYVAGMSAGGAMAAVLARDYPDLYAALGVHSGLPAGEAHDMHSAMQLMSKGPGPPTTPADPAQSADLAVARIVFHGDGDTTVHPANAAALHAAPGVADELSSPSVQVTTPARDGRRAYTRSIEYGPAGVPQRELWIVHGAGHAWAGGDATARHTDAEGPDASREMLRFFLQHRRAN
jgi:poly(hydroxyalkanoate) depolymerase family esterase